MKIHKSSLLMSIVIIGVFAGGLYAIIQKNRKPTAEVPVLTTPADKTFLLVDMSLSEDKKYDVPTKYAVFDVTYPQFKNASIEFNERIANLADKGIANHTVDSEENWKARYQTSQPGNDTTEFPSSDERFQFEMSWKPEQLNNKFISILVTFSGYTGGAHGYQNMVSYNYDVVGKKDVTLADLFPNDSNYLKTVSVFVRKDLTIQFRERLDVQTPDEEKDLKMLIDSMMIPGTEPKADNFSVFTFTSDTITFYFTQYQVAPYAMGEFTVKMPRK